MNKIIGHCICALIGCHWEETAKVKISSGPRGAGTITWEECTRCGETRCQYKADFNFGKIHNTNESRTIPSRKLRKEIEDSTNENDTPVVKSKAAGTKKAPVELSEAA